MINKPKSDESLTDQYIELQDKIYDADYKFNKTQKTAKEVDMLSTLYDAIDKKIDSIRDVEYVD